MPGVLGRSAREPNAPTIRGNESRSRVRDASRRFSVTRAIPCMRDKNDLSTFDLFSDEPASLLCAAALDSGHPEKAPPLSDAERARRYRARKKARLAALRAQGELAGITPRP